MIQRPIKCQAQPAIPSQISTFPRLALEDRKEIGYGRRRTTRTVGSTRRRRFSSLLFPQIRRLRLLFPRKPHSPTLFPPPSLPNPNFSIPKVQVPDSVNFLAATHSGPCWSGSVSNAPKKQAQSELVEWGRAACPYSGVS